MHTASRCLEPIQKVSDDIGAIQRRFANRGRRPYDAAVASHELCELGSHARLEQRHANAVESVTPWLGH